MLKTITDRMCALGMDLLLGVQPTTINPCQRERRGEENDFITMYQFSLVDDNIITQGQFSYHQAIPGDWKLSE